ncbi:MAG: Gfo/Idh/MocA family oxidoreductase, partial [Singulisphaera sp.]
MAAGLAAVGAQDARAEDAPASRKAGPNDTVRVAVIGVRGRGKEHLDGYAEQKDARVTTICDVDRNVLGKTKEEMVKRGASEPKLVTDLRRILDDKDIDAVSIAMPNHWHA